MKHLNETNLKAFALAIILVGIGLALVGLYQYIDASQRLSTNVAQRVHDSGEDISALSNDDARSLMASDLERRDLLAQQNRALIVLGVGLALGALGWLANDFLRSQLAKKKTDIE